MLTLNVGKRKHFKVATLIGRNEQSCLLSESTWAVTCLLSIRLARSPSLRISGIAGTTKQQACAVVSGLLTPTQVCACMSCLFYSSLNGYIQEQTAAKKREQTTYLTQGGTKQAPQFYFFNALTICYSNYSYLFSPPRQQASNAVCTYIHLTVTLWR